MTVISYTEGISLYVSVNDERERERESDVKVQRCFARYVNNIYCIERLLLITGLCAVGGG